LCGIYLSHHAAQRFLRSPDADVRARTAFDALIARAVPVSRAKRPRSTRKERKRKERR
jgi:hypothetical protein